MWVGVEWGAVVAVMWVGVGVELGTAEDSTMVQFITTRISGLRVLCCDTHSRKDSLALSSTGLVENS